MKTPIEQGLTAYLSGYTRNNPVARAHVETYPEWGRMARLELERRAARLLEAFNEEELQAIASGDVSLSKLVANLPR